MVFVCNVNYCNRKIMTQPFYRMWSNWGFFIVELVISNEATLLKCYLTSYINSYRTKHSWLNTSYQISHIQQYRCQYHFFLTIAWSLPSLRVVESSWIHSFYPYSCKEKKRCGRGNCNLKRNVTNLLSHEIFHLFVKHTEHHPHHHHHHH